MSQLRTSDALGGIAHQWPALSSTPCVIHKLLVGAPPPAAAILTPGTAELQPSTLAPLLQEVGEMWLRKTETSHSLSVYNNAFMVTLHQLLLCKMFIRIQQTDWYVKNDSFASDKWSVQTTIPKVLLKYNVFFPVLILEDLAGTAGTLGSERGASLWTISHTAGLQHWGHAVTHLKWRSTRRFVITEKAPMAPMLIPWVNASKA